jgi:hypothetical protein
MRETGTGQQVIQLLDCYMTVVVVMMIQFYYLDKK